VWAHLTIAQGRGDLGAIRGASTVRVHAGLWEEGYRIRAASSILETVLRGVPEHEANPELFHLLTRTIAVLASTVPTDAPPRLDPVVLSFQAKLLVVSGLLPRLGGCVTCGAPGPLVAFSAHAGGALCPNCARAGEPLAPISRDAFAALVAHPVADARAVCPPSACLGVERMIGLVLLEHLGVNLRSATPV